MVAADLGRFNNSKLTILAWCSYAMGIAATYKRNKMNTKLKPLLVLCSLIETFFVQANYQPETPTDIITCFFLSII